MTAYRARYLRRATPRLREAAQRPLRAYIEFPPGWDGSEETLEVLNRMFRPQGVAFRRTPEPAHHHAASDGGTCSAWHADDAPNRTPRHNEGRE